MDDAEIIRQVLSGRHEQFSVLVERYQGHLAGYLRKITGKEEEALDCTQEAFLAAYRNLWRYSPKYTFRAWLFTIARNKALDSYRKRRKEIAFFSAENLMEEQPGPEEQWLMKEDGSFLREVVAKLPEHYQQVLYLRYQQDMSYEEISLVLNIPISRVKTYLHRSKKKLRQDLERRDIGEGSGENSGSTLF